MKPSIIKDKFFVRILIAAIWITLWQLLYVWMKNDLLLASPRDVFFRLLELGGTGDFWMTVFMSVFRMLLGFFLGVLAGVISACLTARIPFFHALLYPLFSIVRATPVASFIILTHVWLKSQNIPVFTAFLMVFPLVWANVSEGILKTDTKFLEMAKVFQFSTLKKLRYIYVPSVMPYFMAAFISALGMAWKASIAAEVIVTTPFSIGGGLNDAKIYLNTADVFAYTFTIILLSLLLETVFKRAAEKVFARIRQVSYGDH